MKKLQLTILAVVVVLSTGAGIAKVLKAPGEVAFLAGIGLGEPAIVAFGVLQIAGAVLLVFPKTRAIGAILTGLGFALSTVAIFLAGSMGFGFFSILPVLLSGWILIDNIKRSDS